MSPTADSSGALEVLQTSALADSGETPTIGAATAPGPRLYIVPRPSRPCEYCGEMLANPRADQRFCRNPRHRRPHLVAPLAIKACDFCGAPIEKPRRGQKFCRKPRRCANNARLAREYAQVDQRRQLMAPAPASAGIVEGARAVASVPELAPSRSTRTSETAPMIGILIESMPAPGSTWPPAARAQWLAVLERTLDALYPGER